MFSNMNKKMFIIIAFLIFFVIGCDKADVDEQLEDRIVAVEKKDIRIYDYNLDTNEDIITLEFKVSEDFMDKVNNEENVEVDYSFRMIVSGLYEEEINDFPTEAKNISLLNIKENEFSITFALNEDSLGVDGNELYNFYKTNVIDAIEIIVFFENDFYFKKEGKRDFYQEKIIIHTPLNLE